MPSVNNVTLMGNLTRDPDLRRTPSGTSVADVGLAMNRFVKGANEAADTEEVTFVDLVLWGKTAENVAKYKSKGDLIYVEGRLTMDAWVDNASGQNRTRLKVTVESVTFLPTGNNRQDPPPQNVE